MRLRRHVVAGATAAVAAAGIALSPAAVAGASQADLATPAAQQAGTPQVAGCVVREGTAATGTTVAGSPTRFRYPDSPYLGARYNSCTGKVSFYYGGYTVPGAESAGYYNIRLTTGEQKEVSGGRDRMYTINAPGWSSLNVLVEHCVRQSFRPSTCTRWSPPVHLELR